MMKLLSVLIVAGIVAVSAKCSNDCSGHGTCSAASRCKCYRNFMGNDCSQRVCYFGRAFVDSPLGDINADGYISTEQFQSRLGNQNVSEMYSSYAGWGGRAHKMSAGTPPAVTFEVIGDSQGEAHFYAECSNKGTCNRQSGVCECFEGYTGEGCSQTACPNNCSGHGECKTIKDLDPSYKLWDDDKTQKCVCDSKYSGPDCSQRRCPKGDDPVTRYKGFTRIKLKSGTEHPNGYFNDYCFDSTSLGNLTEASWTSASTMGHCAPVASAVGVQQNHTQCNNIKTKTLCEVQRGAVTQETDQIICKWVAERRIGIGSGDNEHFPESTAIAAKRIWSQDTSFPLRVNICSDSTVHAAGCVAASGTNSVSQVQVHTDAASLLSSSYKGLTWNAYYSRGGDSPTSNYHSLGFNVEKIGTSTFVEEKDLCYHTHNSGSRLCMTQSPKYTDAAEMNKSVLRTHKMVVTGSGSAATGTMSGGGCMGPSDSLPSTHECKDLDFWSIYVKDVMGTFEIGDSLNIKGYEMEGICSAPPAANGTTELSENACNASTTKGFATISGGKDSAVATAGQHSYANQNAKSTVAFNYDLCNYIESISTYYSSDSNLTSRSQENEVQVITIKFNEITPACGTRDSVYSSCTELKEHAFGGHFSIEFTDEMGDTWMTESIAITSSNNNIMKAKPASVDENTSLASLHPDNTTANNSYEIMPKNTSPKGNGGDTDIHASIGGDHTDRLATAIKNALNALPQKAAGEVDVNFIYDSFDATTTQVGLGRMGRERSYAVTFKDHSGNIPPMKTAYALTDTYTDGNSVTHLKGYTNAKCSGSEAGCITPYTGSSYTNLGTNDIAKVVVQDTSIFSYPNYSTNKAGRDGSTENVECSNRGLCDTGSGQCRCFAGYTGHNCSEQNALSMA